MPVGHVEAAAPGSACACCCRCRARQYTPSNAPTGAGGEQEPQQKIWQASKSSRTRSWSVLKAVDGLDLRRRGRVLKPCGRAPTILVRNRHQPVLHRVLMDIVQTR